MLNVISNLFYIKVGQTNKIGFKNVHSLDMYLVRIDKFSCKPRVVYSKCCVSQCNRVFSCNLNFIVLTQFSHCGRSTHAPGVEMASGNILDHLSITFHGHRSRVSELPPLFVNAIENRYVPLIGALKIPSLP